MVPAQQRREVLFRGRVQGVGFRYTTLRIAANYQVVGFVQNLADGRVRLVVEGSSQELGRFLSELESTMGHHITAQETVHDAPTGEFEAMEIRY
jgi:acylphosphatase